ncbi:MAG: multidrug ABC transporter ATP-binding protein [Candidatus Staskawiczbacteria bacterium RIFCSPLOWO2_01_FULL_40_39]|uniref:Multidrug ABC transporter ATP-binding protein n=1 Tax=Candidatus Staskawiczbacteria bacterium RIFCSPHIGHO2_01_FULL_39_25 TaxID=1802202 RepID=A0A1G2HP82_9BACT|nr:MAG: multidrug ABC transporter ATP-binding protein [Candidatus Staskawiczbacteria bacterium RIFCSPHIGHO2_01_FULL_39_25]OGZ73155.1 MAG: multidrug ABC transporter ATP-binding protein [Candidatus Staskawiczbacteria bacterium RIFCSPLOWO2_01_FULL_40_39]
MENIIETKGVTKKYGDFAAVNDISFSVQKGEVFAFLGPNGAGKTTTIKMLTTLVKPTSGSIIINGCDPMRQQHQVRASFGIVFQDPSLDNELTAYENMQFHAILYGLQKPMYHERILDLLRLVELYDRRDSFVKNFSGGMKRRLEIARGLLHHPKILFLDEPTIGLDPQTRNHIWSYINNLNKKEHVTIFFTTHHMEEVERIAQRIAIIDHGKILIIGTIEEILQKAGVNKLEDAFITLTGSTMREEQGNVGLNQMRINNKLMR